jgi:hypothetical protein
MQHALYKSMTTTTVPTSDTMEHMLFPSDFNLQHSMHNCQSRLADFVALNSF